MAFQVTTENLSMFLLWFLYYDVVEIPQDSKDWFSEIPNVRQWIELGTYLRRGGAETQLAEQVGALDRVCESLRLRRELIFAVKKKLIRLSDPKKMARTSASHIFKGPDPKSRHNPASVLRYMFEDDLKLVKALVLPSSSPRWKEAHEQIMTRLEQYLHIVIKPLITYERNDSCNNGFQREDNDPEGGKYLAVVAHKLCRLGLPRTVPMKYYEDLSPLGELIHKSTDWLAHSLLLRQHGPCDAHQANSLFALDTGFVINGREAHIIRVGLSRLWQDGSKDTSIMGAKWDHIIPVETPTNQNHMDVWGPGCLGGRSGLALRRP